MMSCRPHPEERACAIVPAIRTRVRASRRMRTRDWLRPHASRRRASHASVRALREPACAARLLNMRASEDDAFWPSEGLTRGCRKGARREGSLFPACSLQGAVQPQRVACNTGLEIRGDDSRDPAPARGASVGRNNDVGASEEATRERRNEDRFADLQEFTGKGASVGIAGAAACPAHPRARAHRSRRLSCLYRSNGESR